MDLQVNLTAPAPRPPKILRIHQVIEKVGLSRATIYRLMAQNLCPKSIRLGIKAVGWIESEIEMWITERQIDRVPSDDIFSGAMKPLEIGYLTL